MFFQSISTPGLSLNTYLIGSLKSKSCAIIDPSRQIAPYLAASQNAGLTITHIIETHVHADFISGAVELKNEMEGKPTIWCSGMGGEQWIPTYADKIVKDGDKIALDSIELQAMHTPGHSPEHLSWLCYDKMRSAEIPWFMFTGDFLFVGGVGRPDLLGEENNEVLANQLYATLFTKVSQLPDSLEIFPCHSSGSLCGQSYSGRSSSTIGYERLCNPYLKLADKSEWLKSLSENFSSYPVHLQKIKQMNLKGPQLLENLTVFACEGGIEEVDLEHLFLLDTRSPQKFADFHLAGSINISLQNSFNQWCSWFIPADKSIGIISDDHYRDSQIISQLRLIGFDQPLLLIALSARIRTHVKGESLKLVTPNEVEPSQICLIDVRSLEEWEEGHVAYAQHIELPTIESVLSHFQKNQPIVTMCRSGMRSSIAASILQKNGFENVASLQGGMDSWLAAGLPVVKT